MSVDHIKKTIDEMRKLLAHITQDLEKSSNGNKAASQRVRTGTVKLEKVAKAYRKESIQHEKKTKGQKKTTKPKKAKPAAKGAVKHKAAPKAAAKKAAPKAKAHAPAHAKAKPKAKAHKTVAKPHAFALKRPTAKLPARKAHSR